MNQRPRCQADGCESLALRKGLCNAHYTRLQKYGSTERTMSAGCALCGQPFELPRKGNPPKFCSPECRRLHQATLRDTRYRADPNRRNARKYGLTAAEYAVLMAAPCAICGTVSDRPHMDHNHETQRRRDGLCDRCNLGLGHFRDDVSILHRAITYLTAHDTSPSGTQPWDRLLQLCYAKAAQSLDPSTQVGAILVGDADENGGVPYLGTLSHNDLPVGVEKRNELFQYPLKSDYVCHAEESAIYAACRTGLMTDGLTLVASWAACPRCAQAIVGTGIRRVITNRHSHPRWDASLNTGLDLLRDCGVQVTILDAPAYFCPIRMASEMIGAEQR